jgi:hypothetical protein
MGRDAPKYLELLSTPDEGALTPAGQPYQPFPVELLPPVIGDFVHKGAVALGCDPACLALPALAVIASAIGNTRTLRLKDGWDEPSVIWSAVVGDSGPPISTAYRKAIASLLLMQKCFLQEFRARSAFYQKDLLARRAIALRTEEQALDQSEPPPRPVFQRDVCRETDIHALAAILEENPRGTLVTRDELDGWLLPFTRLKGKHISRDRASWLDMHLAGPLFVNRGTAKRGHHFVPRAAVSVTGSLQPQVLARALTPDAPAAGLAALFLLAMPPQLPMAWSETVIDLEVERAYNGIIGGLLALDFDTSEGTKLPRVLSLSPEAKAAWIAFYDAQACDAAAEASSPSSKLEGYAARLTLLHHVVSRLGERQSDLVPIDRDSVEAGVALCRWFATEKRRIHAILFESAEEHSARCLAEIIRTRGGRISVRGLMRANARRYPDAETAEAALESLVESGLGRWSPVSFQFDSQEDPDPRHAHDV